MKSRNKVSNDKDDAEKPNIATDTSKLETEDEKTARIRSLWVMNIETLIFALSFSIVITGVLPYLRQVIYAYLQCVYLNRRLVVV